MNDKTTDWKRIHLFYSASYARNYLTVRYEKLQIENASAKAYDNCYSFLYYLEQGETFYKQAAQTPLSIKPILLYYGLIHLIKACLLSIDPHYPHTTSVLAHGVSTRKRKKRDYQFFYDEVKVQKNGLCTYFAERMFHVKHLEGEKIKMGELLELVVELVESFSTLKGKANMIKLPKGNNETHLLPEELLNAYHMGKQRVKEYLTYKCKQPIHWEENREGRITFNPNLVSAPPFRAHIEDNSLWLPSKIHPLSYLPDLLVHYLILYNLSMISRYETEWWMELIKTTPSDDFPFIKEFLDITERKAPMLISNFLSEEAL